MTVGAMEGRGGGSQIIGVLNGAGVTVRDGGGSGSQIMGVLSGISVGGRAVGGGAVGSP